VQTVSRAANDRFYDLLQAVGGRTGIPVVLNTSFNVAGEPIVEAPSDAVRTFIYSGMDRLYIGDFVVSR
jgi:carbamoyltransferase